VKWLDNLLLSFGSWLLRSGKRIARIVSDLRNPPYRTQVVEAQLPPVLAARTLYVVQEDGYEEQAAMMCPCGCGRVLHMNLLTDERPCWTLKRHSDGTSTLHPSVWRQKDCRSHFWFRKGRVVWCRSEY
jgi:hypothetical protein